MIAGGVERIGWTVLDSFKDAYIDTGMIPQSFELSNLAPLPRLLSDAQLFEDAVAELRSKGQHSVPYLTTDAIRTTASDPAITSVVAEVLGTDEWVMWGANIRNGTPNEAHLWHVDLESCFWPSLTVVVGVSGCTEENATWVVPGSQNFDVAALEAVDMGQRDAVMGAARGCDPDVADPVRSEAFGDGRFYIFDARAWHAGNAAASNSRCALFMHYHRASDLRVPQMKDYRHQSFYRRAASYIDGSRSGANTSVALGPHAGRVERALHALGL